MPGHVQKLNMSALETQVGGGHYKDMKIQPVEFIHANKIPFIEGNAITYICRHRLKGGAQDIRKAIHMLEQLIELEYSDAPTNEESKWRRTSYPYCCTKCGVGPLDAEQMMAHKCGDVPEKFDYVCEFCGGKASLSKPHLCPAIKAQ